MNNIILFTEEEKEKAANFALADLEIIYSSGISKHGLIISNGEIIGREAEA